MHEKFSCNYFDIFGLNSKHNMIARLDMTIQGELYKKGFEFERDKKYSGLNIAKRINDIPVINFIEPTHINLEYFSFTRTAFPYWINTDIEEKLYRFADIKWNKLALKEGKFQIKPSIYYVAAENNMARHDNEHIFESIIPKESNPKITTQDGQNIDIFGDIKVSTFDRDINKYIFCMSYDYDDNFYSEFGNSCLLIHDFLEFERRLISAVKMTHPHLSCVGNRVSYSKAQHGLGILFTKAHRFMYQREYRFCWFCDTPILIQQNDVVNFSYDKIKHVVTPLDITIGNIEDIAEIIVRNI